MALIINGVTIDSGVTMTSDLSNPAVFNTAGTYYIMVPSGVSSFNIVAVGGGGGGAGGLVVQGATTTTYYGAGGGAGGNVIIENNFAVTSGTILTLIVGAGGSKGLAGFQSIPLNINNPSTPGQNGGSTIIKSGETVLISAAGGNGAPIGGNGATGIFFGGSIFGQPNADSATAPAEPLNNLSGGGAAANGFGGFPNYSNPGSGGAGGSNLSGSDGSNGRPGYISISW